MKTKVYLALCIAFALALTGCATPQNMALQNDSEVITEESKPILLMTATIKNIYKQSFQPKLLVVHVETPEADKAEERLNFKMDDKGKFETGNVVQGNHYYIRMQLEPGEYVVRGLTSIASSFPIHGFYFTPLHSTINVQNSGVYYLGHIDATVRERQGEEFKAGPSLPLIDQAIAGASTGSFDVEIKDNLEKDENLFKTKFPALKHVEIQKSILPEFDRETAQKWWEES